MYAGFHGSWVFIYLLLSHGTGLPTWITCCCYWLTCQSTRLFVYSLLVSLFLALMLASMLIVELSIYFYACLYIFIACLISLLFTHMLVCCLSVFSVRSLLAGPLLFQACMLALSVCCIVSFLPTWLPIIVYSLSFITDRLVYFLYGEEWGTWAVYHTQNSPLS